jgi:hypothetical protein
MIMDPFDPASHRRREKNKISDAMIASAQNSPVYKFVKKWQIALPLHPDFRTLPMLYYVPPMLPVLAKTKDGNYDVDGLEKEGLPAMLSSLEKARMPIKYMASLFSAGNVPVVEEVYRKLIAVRIFKRAQKVKDYQQAEVDAALSRRARPTPKKSKPSSASRRSRPTRSASSSRRLGVKSPSKRGNPRSTASAKRASASAIRLRSGNFKVIKHKGHEACPEQSRRVRKGFKDFPARPFVTFVFKKNFAENP